MTTWPLGFAESPEQGWDPTRETTRWMGKPWRRGTTAVAIEEIDLSVETSRARSFPGPQCRKSEVLERGDRINNSTVCEGAAYL